MQPRRQRSILHRCWLFELCLHILLLIDVFVPVLVGLCIRSSPCVGSRRTCSQAITWTCSRGARTRRKDPNRTGQETNCFVFVCKIWKGACDMVWRTLSAVRAGRAGGDGFFGVLTKKKYCFDHTRSLPSRVGMLLPMGVLPAEDEVPRATVSLVSSFWGESWSIWPQMYAFSSRLGGEGAVL